MLTATYVLLTLSIEQKKERHFIARMLHYVQTIARRPQDIDPVHIQQQLQELISFAETRHQRKVEACLLPAIRAADAGSATLVKELERLSNMGRAMLNAVNKCLRRAMRRSASHGKFLCRTIDLYCHNLLTRLDKEERELLPLAQKVISSEEWFEIGSQFLEQESAAAGSTDSAAAQPPVAAYTGFYAAA